ncbi:MAG: hypothetical protein ACLP1D_29150 [Xanthobacteraceae bacterium]
MAAAEGINCLNSRDNFPGRSVAPKRRAVRINRPVTIKGDGARKPRSVMRAAPEEDFRVRGEDEQLPCKAQLTCLKERAARDLGKHFLLTWKFSANSLNKRVFWGIV